MTGFHFFSLSNFCGFNKKNLSFLLFLLTVLLSVLFNNSSPVVSEDEEGRGKNAEREGGREGTLEIEGGKERKMQGGIN